MEMEKTFEPQKFENDLYTWWQKEGFFAPKEDDNSPCFSIVSPPPNITGQLHLGHALDNAIMDSLVRFKRMQGFNTLWVPGTDHASIATEMKVVEKLKSQGIPKHTLSREQFLEHAWAWKEKYGNRIVEQIKLLGCSCDFSRLAFTMDEKRNRAVKNVFKQMYDKKLIYRGSRIINWCVGCKTALSDAEVEYEEQEGNLWFVKYFSKDGSFSVTVATTRPETMLGDTAVAVNPSDKRFSKLVGKTVVLPFVSREIPIVADSYVDMNFGTGAVKITPAHDPNDFEVGLRHNLPIVRVMNDDGTMNSEAGEFCGLDRYECRKKIVEQLQKTGNLEKIEKHKHNVGACYRCKTTAEPIVSKQWFVKMDKLAQDAIEVVKNGETKFFPQHFEKTYFNWMENIRDWCISRQLWWGHRIPVWYCDNCGAEICSVVEPKSCKCGGTLRQDNDVLDTWFSSGLWPFAVLNYFEKDNSDFQKYFPTSVLSCGYDLIFFWVARMIFSSRFATGKVPFFDVLLHGMVRDGAGKKMSKSAGNGVDPVEFIEKYGTDTLRFALLNGVANGSDMRFADEKIEGIRNFMNKIWNASRFVLLNCEGKQLLPFDKITKEQLTAPDKWILTKLNETAKVVNELMEKYELGLACQTLFDFVWSLFCDWYIEFSKPILYGTDDQQRTVNLSVLVHVLTETLKLLHPFAPFVTEKIYQSLPMHNKTIMLEKFPTYQKQFDDFSADASLIESVKELISKIRNIRAEYNVPPSKRIKFALKTQNKGLKNLSIFLEKLCNAEKIEFVDDFDSTEKTVNVVFSIAEVEIPLGNLVDKEKEIERLKKELENVKNEHQRAKTKLENQNFVSKAPPQLIESERAKLQKWQNLEKQLTERLKELET